jgi:hypothetical protein
MTRSLPPDYSPDIANLPRHGVSLRNLARVRVIVCRDHTNSAIAAGIGQPWLAYCPCCTRGASFTRWLYAAYWATGHAYAVHPLPEWWPHRTGAAT